MPRNYAGSLQSQDPTREGSTPLSRTRISAVAVVGFVAAACASGTGAPAAEQDGQRRAEGPPNVTCVGTEEELLAPLGETEGTTGWSEEAWPPSTMPNLAAVEGAFPSAEDLMAAVADGYTEAADNAFRQEGEQRFEARLLCDPSGAETQGAVVEWGFLDDSVVGADLRLLLVEGTDGWQVAESERRSHCRRGRLLGACL